MARKKKEEIDFSKMVKVVNEAKPKEKGNSKFYASYSLRVITLGISLVIIAILIAFLISKSISISNEKKVSYTEKSNADYKVVLKQNNFYDEQVLEKNYSYIANLINKIKVNYNYDFKTDSDFDTNLTYDIIGVLKIVNPNTNEEYFTKKYMLKDSKEIKYVNEKNINIQANVDIDYNYYNALANKFKATYAVDTDSSLIVTMRVKRKASGEIVNSNELNNNTNTSITIPLSQKAISINIKEDGTNNHETVWSNRSVSIDQKEYLVVAFVLVILAIVLIVKLFKTVTLINTKPIGYDVELNRLLKNYDRLIVNVGTAPELSNFTVIKISKFEEILDLHDNYREPIRFIEITKHVKSYFYIQHNDELFLYVLKSVDVEK